MNKTKIDWCESSWNPVTGCYHDCPYCYANTIAKRFGAKISDTESKANQIHVLSERQFNPYPFGFQPTFHQYRLEEYQKKRIPRNIFVGSMTDLFGSWVPKGWKKMIFEACMAAPWHKYLFLTKSPEGIPETAYLYTGVFQDHPDNFWFGTTVTCQRDLNTRLFKLMQVRGHMFLSIEPLLEEIDLDDVWPDEPKIHISVPQRKLSYLSGQLSDSRMIEWVIIGAETGNRKGKVIPQREWIEKIAVQCRLAGIPIFMKASLRDVWGKDLIQEYPEKLERYVKIERKEN